MMDPVESITANYSGMAVLHRLKFAVDKASSTDVKMTAGRALLTALKSSSCVEMYKQQCDFFGSKLGPEFILDAAWVEENERKNQRLENTLESQLHTTKSEKGKENIRIAHLNYGDFMYSQGNLEEAVKQYNRMRDCCTTVEQMAEMYLRITIAHLDMGQYSYAATNLGRGESAGSSDPVMQSSFRILGGRTLQRTPRSQLCALWIACSSRQGCWIPKAP
jgi:COP9 signalosome complex subunit 1